jgi:phosphohistidine phosphatase
VALLAQNLNLDQALYIGHLPHLEKLIACLLTGDDSAAIVRFQNSGVLCLEKENNRYHIKWLLTAELAGLKLSGHELTDDTLNP